MRVLLALLILMLCIDFSFAQAIPSSEEGAHLSSQFETQQRQIRQPIRIAVEGADAPDGADTISLVISSVRLEGSTIYDDAAIDQLASPLFGATSLDAIYAIADSLTAKYGEDGYILSRVIVPPQELDPNGAAVVLEAVEGYVDEVIWPDSVTNYPGFFDDYTEAIVSERPLRVQTLERYLLLAGDLPGFRVGSRLVASEDNPRASTLYVAVDETPIEISLGVNNYGSEGRGPVLYKIVGTENNRLGIHEQIGLAYSGSLELSELQYLSGRYSQVLNSEGLTASLEVSHSAGAPGTSALQTLAYESRSLSVIGELVWPVIRQRELNLSLFSQAFLTNTSSDTLGSPFNEDRLRGVRAGFRFSNLDPLGGMNQANFQLSQGIAGLGATSNGNALASRTNGQVDFTKVDISLQHQQPLDGPWSAFFQLNGQFAFTPLLASEECTYGGQSIGRAFESASLAGDHCISALAELRYDIDSAINGLDGAQAYAFVDAGVVWRRAPAVGTASSENAGSAGIGLRTIWDQSTTANFELSKRIWGSVGTSDVVARVDIGQRF